MELQKTSILKKKTQEQEHTKAIKNISPRKPISSPTSRTSRLLFNSCAAFRHNSSTSAEYLWKSRSSSPDLQMDFENLCCTSNLSNVSRTHPPWKNLDISGLQSPVPHPEWQQLRRSLHLMTTRRFSKKHVFGVSKTQTLYDCVANGYKMNKTFKNSTSCVEIHVPASWTVRFYGPALTRFQGIQE